jgi:hypothetical protein
VQLKAVSDIADYGFLFFAQEETQAIAAVGLLRYMLG